MNDEVVARLKEELAVLRDARIAAGEAEDAKRNELAAAIAAGLGLSLGAVVRETKTVGFGSSRKDRIQRYKVTRIYYRSYGQIPISVYGQMIRKDGTLGDRHEIYGKWTVEEAATPEPEAA